MSGNEATLETGNEVTLETGNEVTLENGNEATLVTVNEATLMHRQGVSSYILDYFGRARSTNHMSFEASPSGSVG